MKPEIKAKMIADLNNVLASYEHKPKSGSGSTEEWNSYTSKTMSSALAAIERITGPNSPYTRQAREFVFSFKDKSYAINLIKGVVESLKENIERDSLQDFAELIHGELFGDFLEMASHLQDGGYKDAAAVIAGSSLEAHLRQLCNKNGIDVNRTASDGSLLPKKADTLNAELAGKSVYNLLSQKSVVAWLELRNKAAHGKYTEYVKDQVGLMIDGIRDFITRNPA